MSSLRRIIKRMIRIYRMWRFVILVEKKFLAIQSLPDKRAFKEHEKTMTDGHCIYEFSQKKSILGRKYSFNNTMRAMIMAEQYEYIGLPGEEEKDKQITISGKGHEFTSIYGLLVRQAKSLVSINSTLAVAISIIALYFSLKNG